MAVSNDSFDSDYAKLQEDITNYNNATIAAEEARNEYFNAVAGISTSSSSLMELGTAFICMFSVLADQGSSMFMSNMNQTAYAMDIAADLTACGNDIQALTNDTSTDTAALNYAAADMDQMIDILTGTGDDTASLESAIGETACSTLATQYETMRQDIYIVGSDSQYNGGSSAHFSNDLNDQKLHSYGEMYDDMALTDTDTENSATNAADTITQAFNMISSTTSNVNSSLQAVLNNQSSQLQSLDSFATYGLQDINKQSAAYVQNQRV